MKKTNKVEGRQVYTKPEVKKHQSVAVVSGSGKGSGGCNKYTSKTSSYSYHNSYWY